jgi:hypothetical protein
MLTPDRPVVRLAVLMLALAACGPSVALPQSRPTPTQRQAAAESAAIATTADTIYKRRLSDLIRRSLLVPVDSLARLHAAIPSTPDTGLYRLRQEIGCENYRLLVRHGQAADLRAFRRMTDSLQRSGLDLERQADRMNAAAGPPLHIRGGDCGVPLPFPHLPDSLNSEVYPTETMRRYGLPRPDSSGRRP